MLYFYPRDGTPGCTKQACSFRDAELQIRGEGAVILGVSTDSAESHRKFRAKHELPFPLLVDEDAQVATAYGAWGEKTLYGRRFIGVIRSTFLIDPKGTLVAEWRGIRVPGHAAAVLERLSTR